MNEKTDQANIPLLIVTGADIILTIVNTYPGVIPLLFQMRDQVSADPTMTAEQKNAFATWLRMLERRNEALRNKAVDRLRADFKPEVLAEQRRKNETDIGLN